MANSKIKDWFLYLIVFFLLMNMSRANILGTRYVPFFIGVVLFIIDFYKNGLRYNKNILSLILFWIILNGLAVIFNAITYSYFRLIIVTVDILLLPYFLFKIYGKKVWIIFEKTFYFLTILSLSIYFLNISFPSFFSSLQNVFIPYTVKSLAANSGYWSAFIYVHVFADNGYGLWRFNGFMWEPGGMAMMLVWAIIFNLLQDGFRFNRRFLVYSLALLLTSSTAGYGAYALILMSKYIKKLSFINLLTIVLFAFIFNFAYSRLEFVSGKINTYSEEFEQDKFGERGNNNQKVNRFQGGVTALIRTINYPLGYGLVSANDLEDMDYSYGVNGLGSLLEMWGIIGFVFLIYQMYKYMNVINTSSSSSLSLAFLFIALLIPFFSNPISRFLLVYMIVITPMMGVFNNKTYILNEK